MRMFVDLHQAMSDQEVNKPKLSDQAFHVNF